MPATKGRGLSHAAKGPVGAAKGLSTAPMPDATKALSKAAKGRGLSKAAKGPVGAAKGLSNATKGLLCPGALCRLLRGCRGY